MVFNGPAMAAHARRVATACIIIIFDYLALSADHLPVGTRPS
jgi:hypothetical protein